MNITECVECGREEILTYFLCKECSLDLGYSTEDGNEKL